MSSSSMINSFKRVPVQLFRVNNGATVKLRDYALRKSSSYDILTDHGRVIPKALDPSSYSAPNGASMRPLGDMQLSLVEQFRGNNVIIFALAAGTELPEDLILVHEHTDHYSLQPAREMSLETLNKKVTDFLLRNASQYTRQQWLDNFRSVSQQGSTHTASYSGASTASYSTASYSTASYSTAYSGASTASSSTAPSYYTIPTSATTGYWQYSEEYGRYYHDHGNGDIEWAPEEEEKGSKHKGKGKGKGGKR